ncbi:hypothetical protein Trydic_g12340 [Trypoxylus dichotomus]
MKDNKTRDVSCYKTIYSGGMWQVATTCLGDFYHPFEAQKLGYHAPIRFAIDHLCTLGSILDDDNLSSPKRRAILEHLIERDAKNLSLTVLFELCTCVTHHKISCTLEKQPSMVWKCPAFPATKNSNANHLLAKPCPPCPGISEAYCIEDSSKCAQPCIIKLFQDGG